MWNSLRRLDGSAFRVRVVQFFVLLFLLFVAGEFGRAQAAISLVQHTGKDAGTTTTTTLPFVTANTTGNFIAVSIRGGLSSSQVFTVTDSNGNTYKQAAQVGFAGSAVTLAIYYAENIKGGANTVTVSMTVSGPLRLAILEYSGVASSNSLDVTAVGTSPSGSPSTSPSTSNVATTVSGDLLLGTVGTTGTATFTAGAGYTIRDFVPVEPNTKIITEDQIQTTAGTTAAGATLAASDAWGAVLAAFKPVGGVAGVPATITATAGTPQSATVGTAFATQFQATVKDSFGTPVNGATVTFAAPGSGASGTFAGGVTTATTNASGVATAAVFTANNTAGAYTVTASVSGVSTPANFSLTNLAGSAASVAATAGTPQNATVNTAFATQFQATVKDSFGNPVSGVTVTFAAPGTGASGTFAGGVVTATTNASGVATAAVFTANTIVGTYTVTATVSGVGAAANFSLTNVAGAPNSITATAGTPQSATVNTAFAIQLQATVKDSFGNLVSGATVTFTAPASGASGTFAGGVKTATTNSSGVATAAVFTANTVAGAYTVTASVSGVGTSANFSLTNLAGAAATITATAGTPQSATINTAFTTNLQATVKDSFGNPVSGVTVTFTAPGSGASGTFAGGNNAATTNASGVATAAIFTANGTAGPYTVTASASGIGTSANFSLTNLGNPPANISATAGTPQSATINTAFTTQLQVTVTDSGNNPVNGVTVTFTAPASGASGTFAGGVNTATTNASGVATSAVFTANSTAGAYTVTATVSGVASPANFSLTNLTGPAASVTATAGTPQSATVGTAYTTQFQATVKDAGGNPVNGVTVTFAAPGSGASGTFAGGNNTATTNASGVATAAVFTANNTAGAYIVTASVSGVGTQANFSLTNLAGSAASIAATAGTPQSATVNTAFAIQLQATVRDSFNNPVSGVTVTFTAPGSGASGLFSNSTVTIVVATNASGVASAAFTANGVAGGPYTVTATAAGLTTVNFSLTNLTAATPASITATAGTPQSAAINQPFATQLQATVLDAASNPVNGATVTFTPLSTGTWGHMDAWMQMNTSSPGTILTPAILAAGTNPSSPLSWGAMNPSPATGYTVDVTQCGMGGSIVINGTTYPVGTTTQSLALAGSRSFTYATVQSFPSGVSQLVVNGCITFGAGNMGSSANNEDLIVIYDQNGHFADFQFNPGNPQYAVRVETDGSGIIRSANTTLTPGNKYYFSFLFDAVGGNAKLALFDPANGMAQVGTTMTVHQITGGTVAKIYIGNSEKGTSTGSLHFENLMFDWTNHIFPNNPGPPTSAASGTFAGGVNTALTNASGVATAPVFTANSTAGGPYTVAATVAGVASSANFFLTNLAGPPSSITATAGTPQSASVNTAFAIQLQATVHDSFNNPVSGVTVTFTAPASGASGTFAGGVNTATTNASGVATAPVFTANSVAGGPYTVTASVSGVASPANFSLTNLAGAAANITLVQHTNVNLTSTTSGSVAFASPNTAGNWIAVCIRGGFSSSQVFTVSDSNSNTYKQASHIGFTATAVTMAIYYAENIKGGANTVSVTLSVSGPLRIAILEYSGVATSSSLDGAVAATNTSTSPNSGNLTTSANGDLLLGNIATTNTQVFTAGSGYTIEEFVAPAPGTKLIAEDQKQTAAGSASASASISSSDTWGAILAAFKASGAGGGPAPTITSLSQTTGAVGVSITITGTNFGGSQGSSSVTFNGTPATTFSSWSATSIVVTVPSGATTGPVVVTVGGVQSNGVTFTVVPAPSISGISPTSGAIGTSVTISGANFGSSQGSSTVTFNGLNAGTATSWSATSIVIPVPNGATTGQVVVTVFGTASNGMLFTVTTAGPSISSLSLTQGPVGATFTVNGSNFGSPQGSSTVTLGGTLMSASNWTVNSFDVTVPSGASTGPVVVTVGGVQSNGVTFTVTLPPNITSIAPTSGPIGTNVVITGTNFGPTVGTIQSFVTFNGTQTRASNWTNTSITAPVPASATTGNVLVYVGGVPSNGVLFTVTPPPSITTLSPNFGPVGTSVTINGANFGSSQGTTTVTFNGVNAGAATSWSAASIVIPVPAGATTGNVVVTESGVPSNGVNFTVTTSSGNIALVQHRNIDAGSSTSGALAFATNTASGNWIGVCIRGGLSSSQVFTVTDSSGNTYKQAFQLGLTNTAVTFALYYAENIKGGADTITVTESVSGPLRFAILEYSGVATSSSTDATPATAQGNSATPNSGNLTTNTGGDLLLGMVVTTNSGTFTAGSGYTIEEFDPAEPNTKLIAEDQLQTTAGTASAGATLAGGDNWGAGLAAFRSLNGAALPISVSISPTTASVPTGYGTQAFTVTVQNDFKSQGVTLTLSGAGCSGATCGTLSNVTATSATYNAPANVPSPATVTLTATSVSDPTKSVPATITVTQGVLTVVLKPRHAAVTMSASQTVQFTSTVYNDPSNLGVTYQVDGNNGGTSASGTISSTGLYTPGTQPGAHTVTAVSNANASVTASSLMAVTDLAGVYTHHNDNARTGQNVKEYGLTPATVMPPTVGPAPFGQLFSCPVDGFVYAEPLWVANLSIGGGTHNVVFIATEHNSVYAFDADSLTCVQYWKASFINPPNVDVLTPANDVHGNGDIVPELGITSTPVIDPATNTLYVVPNTREITGTINGVTCTSGAPCYPYRLHALDLITGAEKTTFNSPVVISANNFDPHQHLQRPALLLANNTLYIAFGSHGDFNPYYGWLMGYDPATLAQKFVKVFSTGGSNRAGIWQSGSGPAVDASGNVYVSTGNGFYDGVTNWGDTAVKLSPTGAILDWFTPFNQSTFNANDIDLASSGILVLPSSVGSAAHPNLAIATGKVAILYLLDIGTCSPQPCTTMGKNNSSSNNDVQEVVPVPPPNTTLLDGGNYGVPAYWNGNIYTTGQNFPLFQFSIANGVIATPQSAKSSNMFPPRGGIPSVSANGTTGGVVWIVDYTGWQNNTPAILDAYDPTSVGTLTLLYSSPATGTGAAGAAVKWSVPTVANGKVYVGGQYVFTVYGLLP